jgi:hypothetical protein
MPSSGSQIGVGGGANGHFFDGANDAPHDRPYGANAPL